MLIKDEDNDFRYTMTIFLMRADRPKYWEFHCPFCTTKVCELDGSIIHIRDITNNTSQGTNSVFRVRCPGGKKWCRMWFEFQLFA